MITKQDFCWGMLFARVQSEPWICLKMFLFVIPIVRQKIKQLLTLLKPYVQHLPRFESTQPTLYQTYKHSINFIKPVCYYIGKSRSGKCVLSSYVVYGGKKSWNTFHRWPEWSLWQNSLLEKECFYVMRWKSRKKMHQRSY